MRKLSTYFILISHLYLITINVGFISYTYAKEYNFEWEANSPGDNVVEYRIYYRIDSENYYINTYESVKVDDPVFTPDSPSWKLVLPDNEEEYCFVMTALNDEYMSDFSDTAGLGGSCDSINFGPSDENSYSETGDGFELEHVANGYCFIISVSKPDL